MTTAETEVAVLGAGPAGLSAAWRTARAGHEVVVLERAPEPGGMAASFEVAGVRVDHGSHRLHPSIHPVILDDLRGLLGGALQWRERNGRIHLEGRWIRFPLQAADLLRRLPPSFALAAARDAALAPLRRPRADTFSEVVRTRLGPTMLRRFYGPYARKLWGREPEELDGEQARRRIAARSPGGLVRKVVRGGGGPGFWYPATGFGAIVEALAGAAVDAGAALRCSREVEAVERAGDLWRVHTTGGDQVTARHVWSTLPLTVLGRVVRPGPSQAVLDAAGRLPHRALVLVYLVVERGRWTPYDAHYLPGSQTPVSRVSEPKCYRAGPDPSGRTVLCAEVPCSPGDAIWSSGDDEVGARVAADLVGMGLPDPAPSAVVTRRLPVAYPVYVRGFAADLAGLEGWAEGLEGLTTLGRHGLHAHDNTHHALAMGWAAAAALRPDGSWDDLSWAAARERFRGHVVED